MEKKLNKLVQIFEGMAFIFTLLLMSIGLLCIKLLYLASFHPRLGTSAVYVVNYQINPYSNMHVVSIYSEMHKFPGHKFENNLQLIFIANHELLLFTISSDHFDY